LESVAKRGVVTSNTKAIAIARNFIIQFSLINFTRSVVILITFSKLKSESDKRIVS